MEKKYIEEIRTELTDGILNFWKKLRDDEYGGWYGEMSYDLVTDKQAVKGGILHARILWAFSRAYTVLGDKSSLEYAWHAYEFLTGPLYDSEQGGIFWSVTYDGKPADTIKHSYCNAFAIYGLSNYYEASKDEEALKKALQLYDLIETRWRDEYGYREAYNRDFTPAGNDKLSENGVEAAKTMNTLLHIYEAYTDLYRVSGEKKVADSMKFILDIFADKVYNPDKHRFEVFFDEKMNTLIDLHSFGHDIESAWLIDRGLKVLDDEEYYKKISPITADLEDCTYRVALDEKKESMYAESERGIVKKNRVWWIQCEAMVGFYGGWQKDNSRTDYLQAVEDIWNYTKSNIIDKREGAEWIEELDESEKPNTEKPMAGMWKCPYHNSRMCYEMIERTAQNYRKEY